MTTQPTGGATILEVEGLAKTFTMHLRGGVRLPVVADAAFSVAAGECVVLGGPSGAGKSSVLKIVAGTYAANHGAVRVRHRGGMVDTTRLSAREMGAVRRETIADVTQFLRAIPRVPAIDLVAAAGTGETARDEAAHLLTRLNLPERLWSLPPATFSGGEKQRVNIAAGFIRRTPLLLVDEPTASLDHANREVVVELIREKKAAGTAVLGIFHDRDVRDAVCDRVVDVTKFAPGDAA
ncbi:phosphonate C-P lyase system protein PhnL [Acuticoccus sediminis]|uniref:Phosphonate C-P lyase system protein PhnL n=1 Tax=Acuticoccus sediminis TaxID=2184697 RepID=A0A8B2P4E4_9HYPH|nr:phosphonate C-P lyase system protein PhnL [Acuticoccus sediminis]RAI03992.1 phosphonate C-P lyase system protein PhnL [Acuticoccus sediminis]